MDIVNLIKKYSSGDKNTLKIVESLLTKIKNEDYKYNSIIHLNDENESNAKRLDNYFNENNKLFGTSWYSDNIKG